MSKEEKATQQIQALLALCALIAETIEECPEGVPEGTLYAMLMTIGCSLERFNTIVNIMVSAGKVKKQGHLLLAA